MAEMKKRGTALKYLLGYVAKGKRFIDSLFIDRMALMSAESLRLRRWERMW
jgi:hypothetical protein